MTNYAELIAEAEKAADSWSQADRPDLLRRLAAAVRELAPPEGPSGHKYLGEFSTASAAMAALDKGKS